MSKRRKIIIALCVLTVGVLVICVLVIGALGYFLFSRKGGDTEIVFAPTEVGTPVGDKVTKDIGPAGGWLSSPDGRITVNIPPNAVPGLINFSIQPIRNMAEDGLGSAYRLEPNGQKFATPVEVLFEYNDGELGDTAPEGLLAVYQDGKGAWRSLRTISIDVARKTFIALTTHFTDIGFKKLDPNYRKERKSRCGEDPAYTDTSFLTRFRVSPERATIHVGESLPIDVTGCERGNLWDRAPEFLFGREQKCYFRNALGAYGWVTISFSVEPNIGYVWPFYNEEHVVYTAPSEKPRTNVVRVFCNGYFRPEDKGTVAIEPCGRLRYGDDFNARLGVTEITIIDRGYRASGRDGPTSYSGVICSLEKTFTVTGFMGPVTITNVFTPTSGLAGNGTSTASNGPTLSGGGSYTVTGIDTDKPQIVYNVASKLKLYGAQSGGTAPAHIDLIPLTGDECKGK